MSRAWVGSGLLVALACGVVAAADEEARTFESDLELRVVRVEPMDPFEPEPDCIAGMTVEVGTTPSEVPLEIGSCRVWFVEPVGKMNMPRLAQVLTLMRRESMPGLSLRSGGANDAAVRNVARVESLRYLDLANTGVSEGGLQVLAGHKKLAWLDAQDVQVTRVDFATRLPALRGLDISGAWLSGGFMAPLARASKLEELVARRASEFASGVTGPLRHCKSLRVLRLSENPDLLDRELAEVARIPKLEELDVSRCKITDAGIELLADAPKLQSVDLSYDENVTGTGFAAFASSKNLSRITATAIGLTPEGAAAIAGVRSLRYVDLSETPVAKAGIEKLAAHGKIEVLILADCWNVDETLIPIFEGMKSLRVLDLDGTDVGFSARRKLREKLPACDVR